MDDDKNHPWTDNCAQFGSRSKRRPKPVLTPKQADSLARNIERLEKRRPYTWVGGVDEDFDL